MKVFDSVDILHVFNFSKFKAKGCLASSLSTYDTFTLNTSLPRNIIKGKLAKLIELTFNREGSLHLACIETRTFSLLNNLSNII